MKFVEGISKSLVIAIIGGVVLFSVGCTKEEPVAPAVRTHVLKSAPAQGSSDGNGTVDGTSSGGGTSITDDGDDQGDMERSKKPHS